MLDGLHGTKKAPIEISGETGVLVDGGTTYEQFHHQAEREAYRVGQQKKSGGKNHFPGLYEIAGQAFVVLKNCAWITLRDLEIQKCWPTIIYLHSCQHITLDNLTLRDGTFAIYVEGDDSEHITVNRCSWVQDVSKHRLWRTTGWFPVHGVVEEPEWDRIDLAGGARAFDGAFFRTRKIKGNVVISNNHVAHAFNGVHMFNRSCPDPSLNNNVQIFGNTFSYMRDNAIEPERGASNWWVHDNQFLNVHKLFSLEVYYANYFYVFRNRAWFTERPGPYGDEYVGGAVFKFQKEVVRQYDGFLNVFNNSWYLRSSYIKKNRIANLRHFNNAISYCDPQDHEFGICEPRKPFFGSGYQVPPELKPSGQIKKRFETDWKHYQINFWNDLVKHWEFPCGLIDKGYNIDTGIGADPCFCAAPKGNFGLRKSSPCSGTGAQISVKLANGKTWTSQGKIDIGWTELTSPGSKPLTYVPLKQGAASIAKLRTLITEHCKK